MTACVAQALSLAQALQPVSVNNKVVTSGPLGWPWQTEFKPDTATQFWHLCAAPGSSQECG